MILIEYRERTDRHVDNLTDNLTDKLNNVAQTPRVKLTKKKDRNKFRIENWYTLADISFRDMVFSCVFDPLNSF